MLCPVRIGNPVNPVSGSCVVPSCAKAQMSMFGGMLSFEVKGGRDAAMKVSTRTKILIRATSLGGVESLIEHRASIEGPGTTSPEGLLRVSIGLENSDDLIEDLTQALA